MENLEHFIAQIDNIHVNKDAENFCRSFLSKIPINCPVPLLVRLCRCLAEYRHVELTINVLNN